MKVIEPATEKVLAEVAEASVDDADRAVARAKAAYPAWRAVTPFDRGQLLRRFAAAVEADAEKLAQLEARNVGKPISDARGEVGMVVNVFNYYAGAPERLLGSTIPVAGGVDMTFREPLGVVALIVPWNFPIAITSWKLGPALAAGNTVVLKPAGLTPLTALELERLALEAGIPEGVLNAVVGAACGVRQRGPGLLRALAHPGRALGARPLHAGAGEGDPGAPRRRPSRRQDRDGPPDLRRPALEGLYVCRGRGEGCHSWQRADRSWVLVSADCAVAGRARRPRCTRGDLRARGRGDPVQR